MNNFSSQTYNFSIAKPLQVHCRFDKSWKKTKRSWKKTFPLSKIGHLTIKYTLTHFRFWRKNPLMRIVCLKIHLKDLCQKQIFWKIRWGHLPLCGFVRSDTQVTKLRNLEKGRWVSKINCGLFWFCSKHKAGKVSFLVPKTQLRNVSTHTRYFGQFAFWKNWPNQLII